MPGSTSFATTAAHTCRYRRVVTRRQRQRQSPVHSVEVASEKAVLQAEIVRLQAQVKELTLENERLKHGPSVHTGPGEAAASPEILRGEVSTLYALRCRGW